jgi:hypothetical protein
MAFFFLISIEGGGKACIEVKAKQIKLFLHKIEFCEELYHSPREFGVTAQDRVFLPFPQTQ